MGADSSWEFKFPLSPAEDSSIAMPLDARNVNTLWSSILVETLWRLGLTTAVICPGSRSGPLAVAFAQQAQIEAIPVLDERSAAFFALGLSRRSGIPTALVCTSGTAGANFFPAVIEAHESRVPLLVLTADRPPELRHCQAGQAIDQVKLYGHFPNWQAELALPSGAPNMLAYLRQTTIQAWDWTLYPTAGPVHLNLPWRDPLAPIDHPDGAAAAASIDFPTFFEAISPQPRVTLALQPRQVQVPLALWQQHPRGVILVGPVQPSHPQDYCKAIAQLAQYLGWPVLADGLSPLRNYRDLNPNLVTTYDLILRQATWTAAQAPTLVIQIGLLPTSKVLRAWLAQTQPLQWTVDPGEPNFDPLHGKTTHLRLNIQTLVSHLGCCPPAPSPPPHGDSPPGIPSCGASSGVTYLNQWLTAEAQVRQTLNTELASLTTLFEGKVAWLLSQYLPPQTPLFIANSTPVRDVEWFWQPGNTQVYPYFNRGANGIDGTLSTAMGIAHRHQGAVLLTGDLALLHDTNGFLIQPHWVGHLTIVLINNNGGGIFSLLPIANFDPPFETYFATPQRVNIPQLCATYGVAHDLIQAWPQLISRLQTLPTQGIRVLEVCCDRQADAQWRQQNLDTLAANLPQPDDC